MRVATWSGADYTIICHLKISVENMLYLPVIINSIYCTYKLVRQESDKSLTCFDAMTGTLMWTHQKDTFQFRNNHGIGYLCWEKGVYICSLRKINSSGGYFTKWMQNSKVLLNRNYGLKEVTSITMDRGKILFCLQ